MLSDDTAMPRELTSGSEHCRRSQDGGKNSFSFRWQSNMVRQAMKAYIWTFFIEVLVVSDLQDKV